ncbi:MAG: RodZ domain-containing protein [Bacillota bacterium]
MSLGQALKEARKARGLSLDLAEEETKIRKKYLVALEEEQYHVLPGRVYAKAFLRTYARFLELDVDSVMAEFQAQNPLETREAAAENRPAVPVEGRKKPVFRSLLLLAGVIVLLVTFNSLYGAVRGGWTVPEEPPGPGIGVQNPLPVEPEPVPVEEPPVVAEGLDLVLQVVGGSCWMRVAVDGEQAFEGTVPAGQTLSFEADEAISLRLGNAGAVLVQLNGEDLGYLGQRGEVVSREFTVEG